MKHRPAPFGWDGVFAPGRQGALCGRELRIGAGGDALVFA